MSVPGSAVATHLAVCPSPVTALAAPGSACVRRRGYLISVLPTATARLPACLGRGGSDHTGRGSQSTATKQNFAHEA